MKNTLLIFSLMVLAQTFSQAQTTDSSNKNYRNFPLLVTLQFQNLATPFHDLKSNFSHVGVLVGTEVSYNGKQNWVQQFQAGFYFNNDAGNGFMVFTQAVYRPTVFKYFYPEVKAGVGWQRAYHPVDAYEFQNGTYTQVKGGKSQLIVPLGISFGYNKYSDETYLSPFISYQVIPALFYNEGIPLNFYSLFQVGTRVHFK
jgi:hypothetical protein